MKMTEFISNAWPAVLILLAGVAAAIGTYVSGVRDGKQKDSIEQLGRNNIKLSEKIELLGTKSFDLTKKIETLSNENALINNKNQEILTEVNGLTQTIKQLTDESKKLIEKVDERADREAKISALTGDIKVDLDKVFEDETTVTVIWGRNTTLVPVWKLKQGVEVITIGKSKFIKFEFDEQKHMLINYDVVDGERNLIAKITKNSWRKTQNYSMANYDDKGFEILNTKGQVAFGIDILPDNVIELRGIFPAFEDDRINVIGQQAAAGAPLPGAGLVPDFEDNKNMITREEFLRKRVRDTGLKPKFKYEGANFIGKRL